MIINKLHNLLQYSPINKKLIIGNAYARDNFSLSLLRSLMPDNSYIPYTGYSMNPTMIVHILNEIILLQKKTIVEFGSGLSTLFIARLIESQNFEHVKFFSIDHDAEWQQIIQKNLISENITDKVTFVHADLRDFTIKNWNGRWYNYFVIEKCLPSEIDLVIVDGPPEYEGTESRFPAMPILIDLLAENFSVFLDDLYRKDEKNITKKWREMLNCNSQNFKFYSVISTNESICTFPISASYERKTSVMLRRDKIR